MLLLALAAAVAALDLGIKDVIEKTGDETFPKEVEGTGGLVAICKAHNPGLPFGHLASRPQLVRGIPLAVTGAAAGIFGWLLPRKGNHVQKLGLALTIGGAVSNLYDRFVRGYVVDYLNVRVKQLKKVVFNIGDVCILSGSLLFFAGEMISLMREK